MVTSTTPRKRSAGARRLLQEAAELANDNDSSYNAAPLEEDLFCWHFTIRGPGGDFDGGVYHGKMVLPSEYPFKPPEVLMLTPSGRFEVNKKICLSISSFHPETWQPSWGIRTALVALMAFFETEPKGAVGSLEAPPAERRRLARLSQTHKCTTCGFDAADVESPSAIPIPGSTPVAIVEAPKQEEAAPSTADDILISEAPSPSQTPPPPDGSDTETDDPALSSTPTTTIFPTAPSTTHSQPPPSQPRNPLSPSARHRVGASPSRSDAGSAPRPIAHSHHSQHPHPHPHPHLEPLAPPGAPRLSPAHLPPSPSGVGVATPNPLLAATPSPTPTISTPAAGSAAAAEPAAPEQQLQIQQLVLPPGVTLAQMSMGGAGGPPMWIDRAIVFVLLALVAAVVRKIA